MKNLTSKLSLLVGVIAFLVASCDKAPVEESKPVKFEITSSTSLELVAEGGEIIIEYTIENPKKGASVMATTNAAWIADNQTSYAEEGKIVLVAEANTAESSRMATIEVRYDTVVKSISVKQLGAKSSNENAPQLSFEGVPVEVSAEGGSYSVKYSVKNPVEGVEAQASTEAKWITNIVAQEDEISFDVLATDSFDVREADIVVSYEGAEDKSFTVKQDALVRPQVILGVDHLDVAAVGGNYEVSYAIVNEISGVKLTLTPDKDWVTAAVNTYSIALSIEANESPEPREATIKVEYPGIEPLEIVVAQLEKGATTESVAIEISDVMLAATYDGEIELQFVATDNTAYRFDIYTDLVNGVIPNGLYSMDNGLLNSKYCYHDYGSLNAKMKEASIEAVTANKETRFDASWKYNDVLYTIEWTGAVVGFDYDYEEESDDSNAIAVEVVSAEVNYDKAGEKQILFNTADQSHQFNFVADAIEPSKPIPDGSYSIEAGTMNSRYCLHDYGWTDGDISTASATIANNADNTTTFKIVWVYNGETYAINWTGSVEGYVYEDVAGQRLDFVPTYVEIADAGFAGLYFYFYDASENELVFNYVSGKVYTPYINYGGLKLEIDTEDYTFNYTDNGDGTYTYDARFVTLDGRIIEFNSALSTTIS